jgi:hypothetical protein
MRTMKGILKCAMEEGSVSASGALKDDGSLH